MSHSTARTPVVPAVVLALGVLALPTRAEAQQVCGSGTFTVTLPSVAGGPGDSVTLPQGCRVYALLVSGFTRNDALDELLFYDLAKFVLEQDGYVHWAWWNNLLAEYMGRPLHRTETYRHLPGEPELGPNPGTGSLSTLVPGTLRWKAVPEEDHQFQADALRMLQAIRARNPDAVIIVAGHSMGGAAVARLGTNTNVPDIDLLAPIDPVGNRSEAVGLTGTPSYNWTRWRAAHVFRGYRSVDCERNLAGLCRNVGTILEPAYNCRPVGPWEPRRALVASLAPLYCPGVHVDPGTRMTFSAKVRRLYHRWQNEAEFPFDYDKAYGYRRPDIPLDNANLLTSRNIQHAFAQNGPLEKDPDKTCSTGSDPRAPMRLCSNKDGHGEIIGIRGLPGLPPTAPLAIAARNWPAFTPTEPNGSAQAAARRQRIIEMRTATANWVHRPENPELCMVSADLRSIAAHILGETPPPPDAPVTTATVSPDPSSAGWHAEPVTVTFVPVASPGETLAGLTVTLTGAQQDIVTSDGAPVEVVVSAEGTTVITYSARDTDLRVETPKVLTVRLDTTPPVITTDVTPAADVQGWHATDVTVAFSAADALSGIADLTPPVVVTTEGAGQTVTGTATDQAGNTAVAVVELNIDRQRTPLTSAGASTWFLAEGASNAVFRAEYLVANPSDATLDVTVDLFPQPDAVTTLRSRTFSVGPTSRVTLRAFEDFGLIGASSARVSARLSGTDTPADIVVERTMAFPAAAPAGVHNAGGVRQPAPRWLLAEGATTVFDTFVLVANGSATPTLVRATYLTADGQSLVTEQMAEPEGRVTFWPRAEHAALASTEFSTLIESLTPGNGVVAERSMYFDAFRAGHDVLGVPTPATTWYFAEGFTGGGDDTAFETFLLLANPGTAAATVTVEYLLDTGGAVTRTYRVEGRRRYTVWVDDEGRQAEPRLAGAAFGMRVTSDQPIVVERAMYWGTPEVHDPTTPVFPWREGHATAGADAPSARWAFAEGLQGSVEPAGPRNDTFLLVANPNAGPVAIRATFVREDGRGVVQEVCVAAHARTNIWTATIPALSGHRFGSFLESVASDDCGSEGGERFVAERAVYLGPAFTAGHVNVGTPWPGAIVAPPPPE